LLEKLVAMRAVGLKPAKFLNVKALGAMIHDSLPNGRHFLVPNTQPLLANTCPYDSAATTTSREQVCNRSMILPVLQELLLR